MTKSELKSKVKDAGSHYFDRDTMRFFNSKLISVYEGPNGVYFVTYERAPHGPGAYSVRHFTGKSVDTVGTFMGYSKSDAQAKAKALAGSKPRAKRTTAKRSTPKRSGGARRRTLSRIRRVRFGVRRRGYGVMRKYALTPYKSLSGAAFQSRTKRARWEVIESKRWVNTKNGRTASPYGAAPWYSDADKHDWQLQNVGWTVRDNNTGTVGIGRQPWSTRGEAQAAADRMNER